MGRQFLYLANDASLIDLALAVVGTSLCVDDGEDFDGWGLGYYDDDRALVRKRPARISGRVDLRELATDVKTTGALGHVRRSTGTPVKPANTQPFRFRSWLFSHVGNAAGNDDVRAALHDALPDFLLRNVRGDTDSEAALHFFFEHLRGAASVDRVVVAREDLFTAMRATLADVDRVNRENGAEQPPTLDFAFHSGRVVVATNRSDAQLAWTRIDGIQRVEPPLFAGHHPKTTDHDHFRAVIVTWDPNGTDGDWNLVDPDHILVVDDKFEVHVEPI